MQKVPAVADTHGPGGHANAVTGPDDPVVPVDPVEPHGFGGGTQVLVTPVVPFAAPHAGGGQPPQPNIAMCGGSTTTPLVPVVPVLDVVPHGVGQSPVEPVTPVAPSAPGGS